MSLFSFNDKAPIDRTSSLYSAIANVSDEIFRGLKDLHFHLLITQVVDAPFIRLRSNIDLKKLIDKSLEIKTYLAMVQFRLM